MTCVSLAEDKKKSHFLPRKEYNLLWTKFVAHQVDQLIIESGIPSPLTRIEAIVELVINIHPGRLIVRGRAIVRKGSEGH